MKKLNEVELKELDKLGDTKQVYILDVPGGYVLSGDFSIKMIAGEENFQKFVERLDLFMHEVRIEMLEKITRRLGVKVRFE